MALTTPIPNLYAQEGVAFSYTFPVTTFTGTSLTYSAFVNRLISGRALPPWLTFNPTTRTLSGTVVNWWDLRTLQIVIEADEVGVKSYSIFLLTAGANDNVGRICWRAGNEPNFILNAANLGSFNPVDVTPGAWVAIATDVTKTIPTGATLTKINDIRTNGGFIIWLWDNNNGLNAYKQNAFDFELVQAGETIAIDFTNGNTRAFNSHGLLWKGLRGKEIYVTNYNMPGFITSRNFQGILNTSAIKCNRFDSIKQDQHIRFIGQPNNHVPFINLYGIGLMEGIGWQIDGSNGYIESSFIEMRAGTIGWHWKPNTTPDWGDRRPSENLNGYDLNQTHTAIHDCFSEDCANEAIYLGGGGWGGIVVRVYHYNTDGTNKVVLHNGVNVHEYHDIQRYNAIHEYVDIEHNIFMQSGWDAIQTRCVVRAHRVMNNYIFETGRGADTNMAQVEGIIIDSVGEVAYNWIEKAYMAGIRNNMLGLDSIHHNIIYNIGNDNYGNPNLPIDSGGYAMYGNDKRAVYEDMPQVYIQANIPEYNPAISYNYDSFQHAVKVKKNNKSYRSLQAGNLGKDPEINPSWWEDTREWVSYIARPDVTINDLYTYIFNNTLIECKESNLKFFSPVPPAQRHVRNNLSINCNAGGIWNAGTGADVQGNIIVEGVLLTDYFIDPINKDFRLKAGVSAIGAGSDLSTFISDASAFMDGYKDYSSEDHAVPPSAGALENLSSVDTKYSWAANGQAGVVNPLPITIDVGPDIVFNLPMNSKVISAVKSDPARVLTTIQWVQIQGPANASILNGATLTATFTDLQQGFYIFQINTVDEFGQGASDQVSITVNPEGIVAVSTFQWYVANDANGTGKALISGANEKAFAPTAYVGLNKFFSRGETPVAKSGLLIGQESLSNWINVA